METAGSARAVLLMATWFNLTLIASEIDDRWYPAQGGLLLFAVGLYTSGGKQVVPSVHTVSLAGALALIARQGMFRSPESRLILHIADPLLGDEFVPLAGPLETGDEWAAAAVEQLKASGQAAPRR